MEGSSVGRPAFNWRQIPRRVLCSSRAQEKSGTPLRCRGGLNRWRSAEGSRERGREADRSAAPAAALAERWSLSARRRWRRRSTLACRLASRARPRWPDGRRSSDTSEAGADEEAEVALRER